MFSLIHERKRNGLILGILRLLGHANHVASMSRGAAGKLWEALKTNGNFCDMTQHEIGENASQFVL